ncbi:glycoside hydrolase family 47 protein [Shewanella sp. GXUN23E]|uniref:glycoside hydrolase family 47 protein n=1 Tax=Shewanella sp. GXUN23E TaxID=3422498 RepID=UPI003D7F0649
MLRGVLILLLLVIGGCSHQQGVQSGKLQVLRARPGVTASPALAREVKAEMQRSWQAYRKYAWGDDVLLPLSAQGFNWYESSLGISPYDAYSTLKVMGMDKEADEVRTYALEMDWDKDVYVQVFEVNIRILGGLLAMYDDSQDPAVLAKAVDFADRLLPAFDSPTGMPYHSVNLRTGKTAGNKGEGEGRVVNVAQAATYLFEFGILSYYSRDPKYYQAAKRATMAVFERRSEIGLPGENIDVETGEWVGTRWHHLQAGVDSYYEYLYKSLILFPDAEIQAVWQASISAINQYLADDFEGHRFYTIVDMDSGKILKRSVSLYDAFFPAIQALSGDVQNAAKNQHSWHWMWQKHHLLPTRYHYGEDRVEYANSELNPEIIESAYYLHQLTGDDTYLEMVKTYWRDINACCRNSLAFHAVEDVSSKAPKDYLATYFFAETLKYFYLAFAGQSVFDFNDCVFNTEAHNFRRDHFDAAEAKVRLGLK